MNHDDRSDRDVCQRRRRRGAYAAVLSAAAGAALAAAMIPAAPAFADPADDAVGAATNVTIAPPTELQALDLLVIADGGTPGDENDINTALIDYPYPPTPAAAPIDDSAAAAASPSGSAVEEAFLIAHPADLTAVVSFDTHDAFLGTGVLALLDAGAFDLDQIFPGLTF
jgi:hypothetical protein